MYQVGIESGFCAAHLIRGHKGKCSEIHGHSWRVEAHMSGGELNERGFVADFSDLKKLLNSILEKYDHKNLIEIPPFDHINPTAENLAEVIFNNLENLLPPDLSLDVVKVWESNDCWASYRR